MKYERVKDGLDRVAALVALILFAPVFLLVAIAVATDGKGRVVFRQERVGKGEKPFGMYKFRSMRSVTVAFDPERAVVEKDATELTKVGRFLRASKLDELPQLWNVLRGEMSFIGPRPLLPVYEYEPWERRKFAVKPGMSGLAQVNGNGRLTRKERSYYDVTYAENLSFSQDVKLFFKTFPAIVKGEKRFLRPVSADEIARLSESI